MLGASVPLAAGALGATVAAPVVFNKAILPLSDYIASTRAGQLITKGLTNPYFTKGVESAFAAHGINHAVNEGIKGPIDAATTALEIAPLAQPMYKGFQYAADVVPRVARFGVSNHTGNWTQFGNNMYRLKPGYVGMNLPGVERRPISYGYNRESVANAAKEEFMDKTRRPLINRAANEDNTLANALDKVMSGTSETRFGTGNRTMTEPGPHEVLTGTYWDIKTGQPVVRGSGLLGTEPISVTATEGTYKSSGNFGNMSSVTNSPLGGGKYGFRNWNELEDYVLNLGLNESEFNYIADLINRTKSFENGLQLGPRTTQGLIPKKMLRNNEA